MSTTVAKRRAAPRAPRSSAAETREKILRSARIAFSRAGFDQLGVRELAGLAGVDPAILMRTFGSKEALFAAVADGAFALEVPFEPPLGDLGTRVARHLLGNPAPSDPDAFDDFSFLMRSAASPTAAPLLAAALHEGFVAPLARLLGGKDAPLRAALMTSCVLGVSTFRFALGSPALDGAVRSRAVDRLGAMLQTCINA